jgi:F0F1-type ATP synthase membrane subunit a
MLMFLADADPIDEVLPHPLLHLPGGLYVSNQMLMSLVAAGLILLIFPRLFKQARGEAPSGARNFFESVLEFLRIEVFRPALKEHTDRFVPFLWTLAVFICFCNVLGQIPVDQILTILTGHEVHFWGTATGSIVTTGALAVCAFVCIHVSGLSQIFRDLVRGTYGHHAPHEEHSSNGKPGHEAAIDLEHMRAEALGADVPSDLHALTDPTKYYASDEHPPVHLRPRDDGHDAHAGGHGMNPALAAALALPLYLWNFAPHPFRPEPNQTGLAKIGLWIADIPMWSMLLVLELLGAVIKPFALMMRLFANMIAGHIVLAALVVLIPLSAGFLSQLAYGAPITILSLMIRFLELFVAFLQTYIFVFLTTLFIASAVAPEH